jgi:hypothetical protein
MNKFVKCVSAFFLWLAALALSAHLIIPHDHHLADTFLSQDENCPASDHHSGLPLHCHAFNDLTSERSRQFQYTDNIHFRFNTFSTLNDAHSSFLQVSYITLEEFSKPFLESSILKYSLLRAPPGIA